MPELPQQLTLLLPALTTVLSAWLSHIRLSVWLNCVIVLIVTLFTAFVWALITPPITHDFWANVWLITGYCIALGYGPLWPLYMGLIQKLPSPFSAFVKALPQAIILSQQGKASSAVTPMIQRASTLPPGQTWMRTPPPPPATLPQVSGVILPANTTATMPSSVTWAVPPNTTGADQTGITAPRVPIVQPPTKEMPS